MNYIFKQKKTILILSLTCCLFYFSAIFSLKSTDFNKIYRDEKITISMNPIYSEGDPLPQKYIDNQISNSYINRKYIDISSHDLYQKPANSEPIAIIPNYVPAPKLFPKKFVVAVNSYLPREQKSYNQKYIAYQGKIPSDGVKFLKPVFLPNKSNNLLTMNENNAKYFVALPQ